MDLQNYKGIYFGDDPFNDGKNKFAAQFNLEDLIGRLERVKSERQEEERRNSAASTRSIERVFQPKDSFLNQEDASFDLRMRDSTQSKKINISVMENKSDKSLLKKKSARPRASKTAPKTKALRSGSANPKANAGISAGKLSKYGYRGPTTTNGTKQTYHNNANLMRFVKQNGVVTDTSVHEGSETFDEGSGLSRHHTDFTDIKKSSSIRDLSTNDWDAAQTSASFHQNYANEKPRPRSTRKKTTTTQKPTSSKTVLQTEPSRHSTYGYQRGRNENFPIHANVAIIEHEKRYASRGGERESTRSTKGSPHKQPMSAKSTRGRLHTTNLLNSRPTNISSKFSSTYKVYANQSGVNGVGGGSGSVKASKTPKGGNQSRSKSPYIQPNSNSYATFYARSSGKQTGISKLLKSKTPSVRGDGTRKAANIHPRGGEDRAKSSELRQSSTGTTYDKFDISHLLESPKSVKKGIKIRNIDYFDTEGHLDDSFEEVNGRPRSVNHHYQQRYEEIRLGNYR